MQSMRWGGCCMLIKCYCKINLFQLQTQHNIGISGKDIELLHSNIWSILRTKKPFYNIYSKIFCSVIFSSRTKNGYNIMCRTFVLPLEYLWAFLLDQDWLSVCKWVIRQVNILQITSELRLWRWLHIADKLVFGLKRNTWCHPEA